MSTSFQLDQRLQADTLPLASWPLCEVLLMNESRYPWVILVPRVAETTELYQLDSQQRMQLDRESVFLGEALMQAFEGDKLNVAALGNVVSQLHIHHIVRFQTDEAWPAPVWGKFPVQAMSESEIAARMQSLSVITDKSW